MVPTPKATSSPSLLKLLSSFSESRTEPRIVAGGGGGGSGGGGAGGVITGKQKLDPSEEPGVWFCFC